MTDGVIQLRSMKISDGSYLRKQLADTEALSYTLLTKPVSGSWFRVWLRMKTIFNLAFMIDVDGKPVGFAGLYNLIPGQSAEMSLVIFDREKRRRGYGSRAVDLLVNNLQTHSIVKSIFVEYKSNNIGAQSFWSKCGFVEKCRQENLITMVRDLI